MEKSKIENSRLPFAEAGTPELDEINKRDILTKEQLCIFLSVPMSTVTFLLKDKSFPKCKIGRYIRFSKEAVKKWVFDGGSIKNDNNEE
ncbi:MAG: helix-turn-helix domain-containing protein [Planctomycetota bacterium]|jgi:excisionase family DNA binding protein